MIVIAVVVLTLRLPLSSPLSLPFFSPYLFYCDFFQPGFATKETKNTERNDYDENYPSLNIFGPNENNCLLIIIFFCAVVVEMMYAPQCVCCVYSIKSIIAIYSKYTRR